MTATMLHTIAPSRPAAEAGRLGRDGQSAIVARMVAAAQQWLNTAKAQRTATVTRLSSAEHEALKAQMFAATADELAFHPDLDRVIAYLQALGQLASAEQDQAAQAA